MAAVVRDARPEDAGFLAWTILSAARAHLDRGWYDIAAGLPEAETLALLQRLALTASPCFWRYDRYLVADDDGTRAGALCAFGSADFGASEAAMAEAVEPLGWGEAELGALWGRGAYLFLCTPDGETEPVWTVENVAVTPAHRGRGVAGMLIERALDLGREAGFRLAQISFLIGNEAAERAYAKAGFRLAEEKRHPEFAAVAGAPGLKRCVRTL